MVFSLPEISIEL